MYIHITVPHSVSVTMKQASIQMFFKPPVKQYNPPERVRGISYDTNASCLKTETHTHTDTETHTHTDTDKHADTHTELYPDTHTEKENIPESPPHTDTPINDTKLIESDDFNDYERVRLENIRRNQEFLLQLGLCDIKNNMTVKPDVKPQKVSKRQRPPPASRIPLPRRVQPKRGVRSDVQDGERQQEHNTGMEVEEEGDISEPEPVEFDDSSVLHYILSTQAADPDGCTLSAGKSTYSSTSALSLSPVGPPMWCDLLPAVYSMHCHPHVPSLLAAAGKAGQVALYSLSPNSTESEMAEAHRTPLMAFRAHTGWISSARFLCTPLPSLGSSNSVLLVTASNDGLVKLWDVTQFSSGNSGGKPRELTTSSCGHSKGVFSLDELSGWLVTGSKDRLTCVSRVNPDGSINGTTEYDHHAGVVKSVSWKRASSHSDTTANIFASGSQDCSVCVTDTRTTANSVIDMQSVHSGGVHTVSWCPYIDGENLLITAGHDSNIKLFDIRKCSTSADNVALHSFREHMSTSSRKSSIVTPCFLNSEVILTPSENACTLSMHCAVSGRTISRGTVSEPPVAVTCSPFLSNGLPDYVLVSSKRKGLVTSFSVSCAET